MEFGRHRGGHAEPQARTGLLLLYRPLQALLLPIVWIGGIVFMVIGGIKANTGEVWKYPLAIPFFT